jgi:hypothetical protein
MPRHAACPRCNADYPAGRSYHKGSLDYAVGRVVTPLYALKPVPRIFQDPFPRLLLFHPANWLNFDHYIHRRFRVENRTKNWYLQSAPRREISKFKHNPKNPPPPTPGVTEEGVQR